MHRPDLTIFQVPSNISRQNRKPPCAQGSYLTDAWPTWYLYCFFSQERLQSFQYMTYTLHALLYILWNLTIFIIQVILWLCSTPNLYCKFHKTFPSLVMRCNNGLIMKIQWFLRLRNKRIKFSNIFNLCLSGKYQIFIWYMWCRHFLTVIELIRLPKLHFCTKINRLILVSWIWIRKLEGFGNITAMIILSICIFKCIGVYGSWFTIHHLKFSPNAENWSIFEFRIGLCNFMSGNFTSGMSQFSKWFAYINIKKYMFFSFVRQGN